MPVTPELLSKIGEYEQEGYTPDEIVAGLKQSTNFPDVAVKLGIHEKNGYTPQEMLDGIKASASFPTPQASRSWSSIPGEALSNVLPSAGHFLKGLNETIQAGPFTMAKNMGKMALGGAELLIPGEQGQEPFARALGQFYANRYGGVEPLKQTMATDPFGFMTDVSSVLSGGGAALGKIPALGSTANVISKAAEFTNPISLASKAADIPLNLISKTEVPESLYGRTMKIPPGSLRQEMRDANLKTLVRDEKLVLNKEAVGKMNTVIGDLERNIDTSVNVASQGGATVDTNQVIRNLDALKQNYRNRPKPQEYYDVIDNVKDQYINHAFNNGGVMTVADAHALKKGTYQEIQDYFMKKQKPETGRVGIQNDVEAAAKAEAAKTLRDEVLTNPDVPTSVKAQLSREAGLLNARRWVERATNRGANLDVTSLSGMLFGVLLERGIPGMAAYRIAVSQPVMSRFAIALGKTRTGIAPTIPNIAGQMTNLSKPGN